MIGSNAIGERERELKDHLGQTRVRTVVANDDAESRTKPRERESERAAGEGD
jgi:hypothetical protein